MPSRCHGWLYQYEAPHTDPVKRQDRVVREVHAWRVSVSAKFCQQATNFEDLVENFDGRILKRYALAKSENALAKVHP